MKIGIYSEFLRGNVLGGREFIAAVLCEELGKSHDVEFVHHEPALTSEQFAQHFGNAVQLRYVEWQVEPRARNPLRRHREETRWHASLSAPYDFFLDIAHFIPPYCHARVGMLMVLFPVHDPAAIWDLADLRTPRFGAAAWRRGRRIFHRWHWRRRVQSYQIKTSISGYSRDWTRKLWGVDTKVIYPPATPAAAPCEKMPLILSVGRFSVSGVAKRQELLVAAYGEMVARDRPRFAGWQYITLGGIGASEGEKAFLAQVLERAKLANVHVETNTAHARLKDLYSRAMIFWHAAGHGQGDNPALAEHYGIATVEAMLAGCVPVVIRKGAQPEIVEHGVSGFLWDTIEELQSYTSMLAADETLRRRMSEAARTRATQYFSREHFTEQFRACITPYLHAVR